MNLERYTCMAPGTGARHAPYLIFDRTKGLGRDQEAIASVGDPDTAYRITRLLNADQSMLERQGVKG